VLARAFDFTRLGNAPSQMEKVKGQKKIDTTGELPALLTESKSRRK